MTKGPMKRNRDDADLVAFAQVLRYGGAPTSGDAKDEEQED